MRGNVHSLLKGGNGIVSKDGKNYLLSYVISGEEVEFEFSSYKKDLYWGKVEQIIKASPFRIKPICRYFQLCGGCNWQHINFQQQPQFKSAILAANLKKIAGLTVKDIEIISSPQPFHYRTKVRFQVKNRRIGFFKERSRELIEIESCLLLDEISNEAIKIFRRNPLDLKELIVLSNGKEVLTSAEKKTPQKLLSFKLNTFNFFVGINNFIQSNRFLLESMQQLLIDELLTPQPQRVTELFAGAGFFTLPLAAHCNHVIAYELQTANIKTLFTNLQVNKFNNVEIKQADLNREKIAPSELIVLDPGRGGITTSLAAQIAHWAEVIGYFSCDSATFSRDLKFFLNHNFQLKKLFLIDNFPQTDHFEIFASLYRC